MKEQIKTIEALLNLGFYISSINYKTFKEEVNFNLKKRSTKEELSYNFELKRDNLEALNRFRKLIRK